MRKKYCLNNEISARDIIYKVYLREFLKIEKMLRKYNKHATLVAEENCDPSIDRLALEVFVKLRKNRKITNLDGFYFTSKKSKCYPSGVELADMVSNSMYNAFKRIEFYRSLKKVHGIKISDLENIDFFDRPISLKK